MIDSSVYCFVSLSVSYHSVFSNEKTILNCELVGDQNNTGAGGVNEMEGSLAMQTKTTLLTFRGRKVHRTLLLSPKRAASNNLSDCIPHHCDI